MMMWLAEAWQREETPEALQPQLERRSAHFSMNGLKLFHANYPTFGNVILTDSLRQLSSEWPSLSLACSMVIVPGQDIHANNLDTQSVSPSVHILSFLPNLNAKETDRWGGRDRDRGMESGGTQ